MKNNLYLIYIIISIFIVLISILLTVEMAKEYAHYFYFLQLLFFYLYLYKYKKTFLYFTPILLLIFYVDFSFFLGNYALYNGIENIKLNYENYLDWKYTNILLFYTLFFNLILFSIELFFIKKYLFILKNVEKKEINKYSLTFYISMAIFIFILFSFIPLDITYLGGAGELSYIPKAISALIVIYILAYNKYKYRYLIYLFILFLFATFSFDSKREVVFFIFPIILLETVLNSKIFYIKNLIYLLFSVIVVIFLIIVMSILRGYGNYDVDNFFEALFYVYAYTNNEFFLMYFFKNIETSYTYFHSMQAMEYILNDVDLITYGSTFIKFLFITIPSSIIDFKPKSLIDIYTTLYDPEFRKIGGSWPPNIVADFFWNFYYFSFIFAGIFFYIINLVFLKIISLCLSGKMIYQVWYLFFYMFLLVLYRGSGLDMFTVYLIFGIYFSFIYYLLFRLIQRRVYL